MTAATGTGMRHEMRPIALRPKDAAAMIGVGLTALDELTRRGDIKCVRPLGTKRVYRVAELERFLAEHEKQEQGAANGNV